MEPPDARQAALRRRVDRPDEPDAVDLARRQQPGVPRHDVRQCRDGVRGAGPRPDRRRRRRPPARDVFDTLNAKAGIVAIENVFEERGIRLPVMISVTITDGAAARSRARRSTPSTPRSPRAAFSRRHQLRARRARDAPVPRGAGAASPTATSAATRTPACPTRSASTTSTRARPASCRASSPPAASSTSSAAAAAPRPTTSRRSRRRSSGAAAARCRDRPTPRSSRAAARRFSGLETLTIRPRRNFQMVGERTNVTGSARSRA